MIRLTTLTLFLFLAVGLQADEPTELAVVESPLSGLAKLPAGWKWDRPVPENASIQGEAIRVRTESGRIWAGTGSRNRIMTAKPIGDSATATATIELVDAVGKWEQCGLLLYQHDDAFVKLVVEHIDGEHFVVMAREFGDKRKVLAKIAIPSSRAELQFKVQGERAEGVWRSEESEAWQNASETDCPADPPRHFAVFSQDGDPDKPRYALVRSLRCEQ